MKASGPEWQILSSPRPRFSPRGQLDLVFGAVNGPVALERQVYVLEPRRGLDQLRGRSRTAVEQVREWIGGGRTDAELRGRADNNSRIPADAPLEGDSFVERPDAKVSGTVFEHRLAMTAYAYVLTVRFGVIAALNPLYRNSALIREELRRHVGEDRISGLREGFCR